MGVAAAVREYFLPAREREERADPVLSMQAWADMLTSFSYQGVRYTLPVTRQEDVGGSYSLLARAALKANGVVFACVMNRMFLFSEARFMFRRLRAGRPGDLFGTPELRPLSQPWSGATTGDLLSTMLLHADIAGNSYVVRRPGPMLTPLRPDWVTLVGGSLRDDESTVWSPDAEVLAYLYQEGGPGSGKEPVMFLPEEVAHFRPLPDPEARFRGMSWITPVAREIMADKAATEHKLAFFENGATPNLVVKFPLDDLAKVQPLIDKFKESHESAANAYKTLFLAGGADATVVGKDMQQLEFKVTQGAGETRIAAAAGVPPVVVGLSEGLAAATYSNYAQARRRFADNTMRPLWRNACGSLARIIRTPEDAELWYDTRDISALQEDQKDAADIQMTRSQSIKTLIDAGYEADSVVQAVTNEDFTLLKHSGLFSVQLQPPGTTETPGAPSSNGANGQTPTPALTE